MKVAKILKTVQTFANEHRSEILTGVGIAGMFTTVGLAIKATPKAMELIEEKKEELDTDELTKGETIKAAWKPYIPTAIVGTLSTVCLIGACTEGAKRTAALATACKLSETALSEYKDKVVEAIGEKKEKGVREKVAQERIENTPVNKSDVILTEKGNTLCFDPLSSRYFKSDIDRIRKAENELNKKMLHDICGYASLNDFYNELGLPQIDVGDILGWNTDNLIDIEISSHVTEEGVPCIVVGHANQPKYEFYH